MKYTICVPSKDRGSKALESVTWMLANLKADILVIDNGSTKDREGYAALSLMPGVRCVRIEGGTFLDSFNACIENAVPESLHSEEDASFPAPLEEPTVAIMCSDEDVISPEGLKRLDSIDWKTTAVVRGSVAPRTGEHSPDSVQMDDVRFDKGASALMAYAFSNSYLSGTAYNLNLLPLTTYKAGAHKHRTYPHIWLDLLGCVSGAIEAIHEPLALEGEAAQSSTPPSAYDATYSVGARLDQHLAMRDGLFEAVRMLALDDSETMNLLAQAYVKLSTRTLRLVTMVNQPQYLEARLDMGAMAATAANYCIGAYISFKHLAPSFEWVTSQVHELVRPQQE